MNRTVILCFIRVHVYPNVVSPISIVFRVVQPYNNKKYSTHPFW